MRDARTYLKRRCSRGPARVLDGGDQFRSIDGGASGFFLKTVANAGGDYSATTTLAIADAGATAADAGGILAQAVIDTARGSTALADRRGFPIVQLAPLTLAVGQADTLLSDALSSVLRSPDSMLVGPVGSARSVVIGELANLQTTVHSGSLLLRGLPTFLWQRRHAPLLPGRPGSRGAPGDRRGHRRLHDPHDRERSIDVRAVPPDPVVADPHLSQVPTLSDEYAEDLATCSAEASASGSAINLTPDFPTAAQAILNAYEVAKGVSLDGVIFADPFALKALLRIEGPTVIPQLGRRVTSDNVVALVTNEVSASTRTRA